MTTIAAWKVSNVAGAPRRLPQGSLDLEQHLEGWIVRDPSLLDDGLVVVARQMQLAGGPLDLLCLDREGGLVVVELKRGGLYRETLAQALDYAASLSTMPGDELERKLNAYLDLHPNDVASERLKEQARLEIDDGGRRDIGILVAGTRRDGGFDRVSEFLAGGWGVPVRVVTFQVLDLGEGELMLVREAQETESPRPPRDSAAYSWESVLANAERLGVAPMMSAIREAGIRHGLHPRPWKVTLSLNPPENKVYTLIAAWPREGAAGHVGVDVAPGTIANFFPVEESQVMQAFGGRTRFSLDSQGVDDFVTRIDSFFGSLASIEPGLPG